MLIATASQSYAQCTDRLSDEYLPKVYGLLEIEPNDPLNLDVQGCVHSGPKLKPESIIGSLHKVPFVFGDRYCVVEYERRFGKDFGDEHYEMIGEPEISYYLWPKNDQRDCEIASIEDIPIYTIVGPTVPVDIGALALDNQHLLFAEALNSEYGSAFESWVEYRVIRCIFESARPRTHKESAQA